MSVVCGSFYYGRNSDRPSRLLIQKLHDISFIVLKEKKDVMVGIEGSRKEK